MLPEYVKRHHRVLLLIIVDDGDLLRAGVIDQRVRAVDLDQGLAVLPRGVQRGRRAGGGIRKHGCHVVLIKIVQRDQARGSPQHQARVGGVDVPVVIDVGARELVVREPDELRAVAQQKPRVGGIEFPVRVDVADGERADRRRQKDRYGKHGSKRAQNMLFHRDLTY